MQFYSATREIRRNAAFRKFRRRLLHSSLAQILEPLKPFMTVPEVTRFPDGHFRKVIYGLGPYIADYPEQALLACIVQGWCARYSSHSRDARYTAADQRFRCTAPGTDLDSKRCVRRSQEHTARLVKPFELGVLWDSYGIVGDVTVRIHFLYILFPDLNIFFSHSPMSSPERTFTSLWPLTYYIN